jgi:hypothetical protein
MEKGKTIKTTSISKQQQDTLRLEPSWHFALVFRSKASR